MRLALAVLNEMFQQQSNGLLRNFVRTLVTECAAATFHVVPFCKAEIEILNVVYVQTENQQQRIAGSLNVVIISKR